MRCPQFAIKYARNPRRKTYRVAIVVSRKVSKSAVVRNRIRRRMYEAVQTQSPHVTQAFDVVFSVFSDQLATMPYTDLLASVTAQLQKSGIVDDFAVPSPQSVV